MRRCIFIILLNAIQWACMAQCKFLKAIEFGTNVTGDFADIISGHKNRGLVYIGKEDLTLELNTQKAGMWNNGFFFIHGINTHGKGPNEKYVGALQVVSNIEAGDHTGLFEFWYKQQIGKWTILLGQHDMNTEFLGSKYSNIFVNSSFGVMPSLSLNMPLSIYPLTSPGILFRFETNKNLIFRLGIYDGNPGKLEDNTYNLNVNISSQEGFFNIGEIEYDQKDEDREIGNFKLGVYFHSGKFPNYSDTIKYSIGNYGIYALIDKALFPRAFHIGRGLCFFLQGGLTTPSNNKVHYYIGGGLRYHGLLPDRYNDQLGIGIAHIVISKSYLNTTPDGLSYETCMETTYLFHFGMHYFIQPSVQYILNPGINKSFNNTLIALMRFSLSY